MRAVILILTVVLLSDGCNSRQEKPPRVFVFTDINIARGDPDDRQSLVHLLWYADELDIVSVVPDRWNAGGPEACRLAIEAYAEDYRRYGFEEKGYPAVQTVRDWIASDEQDAIGRLHQAATGGDDPLYVLIWGNMRTLRNALREHPEIADHIRVISIGTGLKYGPRDEVPGEDCTVPNWNGPGRNDIYNDPRFDHMWWLEINWTYNGMFSGEGPTRMFEKLSRYGKMGRHIREVTREHPWARYFRVGDTPSVLYLIDPSHDPDHPETSSWAGKFKKPLPQKRPHYYTDDNGPVEWDYEDPCNTWHNLEEMYAYNKSTLEKERPEMYGALLEKLEGLYETTGGLLAYVSPDDITVTDPFWGPKLETNRTVTIPHNFEMCEKTGVVDNFRKAAGWMEGEARGLILWDNALHKTIEAASWSLMQEYDKQLDRYLDSLIGLIGSAQQENGYLKTDEILAKRKDPGHEYLDELRYSLEIYTFGHMIEAAAAHYRATGKTSFLHIAERSADLLDSIFGPGRRRDVPGHEEVETALVRLYKATGEERYLELSRFFIDERGNASGHELMGPFHQDHLPVVEQQEAVGQAPRAAYLYSGMADVAFYEPGTGYLTALDRLWVDVVHRKMYITGGIGSRHKNEGFGQPYDLPNARAYSEPCAAISLMMWNTRMFSLEQDARYFEVFERTMWNNFLAGVSLSGDRYFYVCPLESDGVYKFNLGWCPEHADVPFKEPSATRKEWFPCPCCPPNIARYMAQLPRYIYAVKGNEVYVNLMIGNEAALHLAEGDVRLALETGLPESGDMKLKVLSAEPEMFTLHVRVPHWAKQDAVPGDLYEYLDRSPGGIAAELNGENLDVDPDHGYLTLDRRWEAGDEIRIGFPLEVRRVVSHPAVKENQGKVALERGPLVYCFEEMDNPADIFSISLPDTAGTTPGHLQIGQETVQQLTVGAFNETGEPVRARAIPYYAWSNRGAGKMAVWVERR
ncbi:MAG: beta-L-arabinofuranosidase domain-containing protein [Bacteroidota bacterium]